MKWIIGILLLANLIVSLAIYNKMGRRITLDLNLPSGWQATTDQPTKVD